MQKLYSNTKVLVSCGAVTKSFRGGGGGGGGEAGAFGGEVSPPPPPKRFWSFWGRSFSPPPPLDRTLAMCTLNSLS